MAPEPVGQLLGLPVHRALRAEALSAELPEGPRGGMPAQTASYQALEQVIHGLASLIGQDLLSYEQADVLAADLRAAIAQHTQRQGGHNPQEAS